MSLAHILKRSFVQPRGRKGLFADERGTTAIEFGLLALPFFALIGAILETALIFLASQILDTAVQDSARFIRTGQAQGANYTEAQYRQAICNGLYGMFDCTKLRVNVSVVTTFGGASLPAPLDTDCTATKCDWKLQDAYNPGTGSSIVLVRVYYKWPTILNLAGFNLQNTGDGTRLLGAVRVFRNEPFAATS